MKNKVFFAGMFCMALVFGIMIFGCTEPEPEPEPEPELITKRIRYEVTQVGSDYRTYGYPCRIDYGIEGRETKYVHNPLLPWAETVSIQRKAGDFLNAFIGVSLFIYHVPSVAVAVPNISFTVKIFVDGIEVASKTSSFARVFDIIYY
jgi:hypothetical protein